MNASNEAAGANTQVANAETQQALAQEEADNANNIINTSTAVFGTQVADVENAQALVAEAEEEYRFRRNGLLVAVGIMVFLAAVIYLKIREIESDA